ncbi:cis-aconitate decarboxylase [Astyanax mexicanus]|uniref:Cis-aconitate decarboxylase n=1 Tax=Astyanax mexicanus TaxID=7994 RepID=A0A8B9JFM5_ASTMX|nr:cis-aconitate decarboxylase [Astyanax mexicanus]
MRCVFFVVCSLWKVGEAVLIGAALYIMAAELSDLTVTAQLFEYTMLRKSVTESFGAAVSSLNAAHLTDGVIRRSKRMMLDTLGVGLLGTSSPVFNVVLQHGKMYQSKENSSVWGRPGTFLPPYYAAFVNGVAVHSMDFDDTWHPATHPSGAVLPALLALAETLHSKPSGLELLLAFNVGLEVQGRLLRFSKQAHNIPKRFHPPAVVGVMGSAAATAKLLGLSPAQSMAAMAIACSSAGAPMANAATQTKPLHLGNAARRGLEASQLALLGLEGNKQILDLESGFGVFYQDYIPQHLAEVTPNGHYRWVLEDQDIAFKRFPAHLGMHWVADAAVKVRTLAEDPNADLRQIKRITLRVPSSRYIDRPIPDTEHQARHSFQFNCCSALLDGEVTVDSFSSKMMNRKSLRELLHKVHLENPEDNPASFEKMYCEIMVEMARGETHTARCNTFYGHWRKPLSQEHLVRKFKTNASTVLTSGAADGIVQIIENLEKIPDCSVLGSYMQFHKHVTQREQSYYSASV